MSAAPVAVALELGCGWAGKARSLVRPDDTDWLAAELRRLLADLGLDGTPAAEVVASTSDRYIGVSVNGRRVRYPPRLLERAWHLAAKPKAANLSQSTQYRPGFPDGWLGHVLEPRPEVVGPLAARLAFEAIRAQPRTLMGEAQASAYIAGSRSVLPQESLVPVLGTLLDLGVSLRDRDVVLDTMSRAAEADLDPADTVEMLFGRLAPRVFVVEINGMDIDAAALDDRLREVRNDTERSLGLVLPRFGWSLGSELPDGHLRVLVDGREVARTAGARSDELALSESQERVEQLGLPGRALPERWNQAPITAVPVSSLPDIDELGLSYWKPQDFAVWVLLEEVLRSVPVLVSIDEVQRQLGLLEFTFPELVAEVTDRFSVYDLCRMMRAMLAEGLNLRDLRSILEAIVSHGVADGNRPEEANGRRWEQLLAHTRRQLRDVVTQAYSQAPGTLATYGVDWADDGDEDELLARVWVEAVQTARQRVVPVVLAPLGGRRRVLRVLARELPELRVMERDEISPNVTVLSIQVEEERMAADVAVLRERVGRYLFDEFGADLELADDGTYYSFIEGSTRVFVEVEAIDSMTVVHVYAPTNQALRPSAELFRWVALNADSWLFGHLGATEEDDGTVTLAIRHTLLGNFLDPEEVRVAAAALALSADALDDQVKELFGGKLAEEE